MIRCFNTSHVTLYQYRRPKPPHVSIVSIHHMLLFISFADPDPTSFSRFQYITCYSLSDVQHLLLVNYIGFNTSHVTLYRDFISEYINPILVSIHHMLLFIGSRSEDLETGSTFQYITCYSLSLCSLILLHLYRVSTHHMLLFIKYGERKINIILGFNTSHVTLYLWLTS